MYFKTVWYSVLANAICKCGCLSEIPEAAAAAGSRRAQPARDIVRNLRLRLMIFLDLNHHHITTFVFALRTPAHARTRPHTHTPAILRSFLSSNPSSRFYGFADVSNRPTHAAMQPHIRNHPQTHHPQRLEQCTHRGPQAKRLQGPFSVSTATTAIAGIRQTLRVSSATTPFASLDLHNYGPI